MGEVLGPAVQATVAQLSMIAPGASVARAVVVDQLPCSEDLLIGFTALSLHTAGGANLQISVCGFSTKADGVRPQRATHCSQSLIAKKKGPPYPTMGQRAFCVVGVLPW